MFFGLTAKMCFVVIVAIFILVYFITPRKNVWFPFIVAVALFSVLAFKIEPEASDDLALYFHHLSFFREGGKDAFNYAISENWYEWKTYRVSAYYFYLISKLPDNHYLPAITIFIAYGLMFLVLYKAANRFRVEKSYLFFACLFLISTYWYYDIASGIRNGLAFTVTFACAYFHLVERKHIPFCLLGYLCSCLMHSTGIIPVALVIITVLTLNTGGKFIKYALIFGLSAGGFLINFLAKVTDNAFIQSIAGRAENHTGSTILETGTMFQVNLVTFIFVSALVWYVSKYIINGGYSQELKRFYKYTLIIIYFLIGCIFSGLIFVRFVRWIIPMIGALFFMIGMQLQKNEINRTPARCLYNGSSSDVFRLRTRGLIMILYFAYTAVHFWYALEGSSLNWIHF